MLPCWTERLPAQDGDVVNHLLREAQSVRSSTGDCAVRASGGVFMSPPGEAFVADTVTGETARFRHPLAGTHRDGDATTPEGEERLRRQSVIMSWYACKPTEPNIPSDLTSHGGPSASPSPSAKVLIHYPVVLVDWTATLSRRFPRQATIFARLSAPVTVMLRGSLGHGERGAGRSENSNCRSPCRNRLCATIRTL